MVDAVCKYDDGSAYLRRFSLTCLPALGDESGRTIELEDIVSDCVLDPSQALLAVVTVAAEDDAIQVREIRTLHLANIRTDASALELDC